MPFLSKFNRNVLYLFTGSSFAQGINFLSSLYLTQLYTPKEFGLLGTVLGISIVMGLISTGSYHLAIVLPDKENEAKNLFKLSFILSIVFHVIAMLGLLVIWMFKPSLVYIGVLIILISFGNSLFNIFQYWLNREQLFKTISYGILFKSIANILLAILFIFAGLDHFGLIYANLIAVFVALIFFYPKLKINISEFFSFQKQELLETGKKYQSFFKFTTMSSMFNSASNSSYPAIFAALWNLELAGIFFFADKLFRTPLGVVTESIGNVYYSATSKLYPNNIHDIITLTKNIQLKLILFLVISIGALNIFGEQILAIFGKEWSGSVEVIFSISILVFFKSLYSSISTLLDVFQKQKLLLYVNISLFFSQVITLFAFYNLYSFYTVILLSSIVGALQYLCLNIYVYVYLQRKLAVQKLAQ